MAIDIKRLRKQTQFCAELMDRLSADIETDISENSWQGICNYTRKQADIIRLRRELNALNKILNPYA